MFALSSLDREKKGDSKCLLCPVWTGKKRLLHVSIHTSRAGIYTAELKFSFSRQNDNYMKTCKCDVSLS